MKMKIWPTKIYGKQQKWYFYSNIGPSPKKEINLKYTNLSLHLMELEKEEEMKPKVSRKEGNNKNKSGNKWSEDWKNKRSMKLRAGFSKW